MADIDVSDLLLDPDFVNDLQLIHRTATISSAGKNVITEQAAILTVGSVQPASQKDIMRMPEAMRLKDVRGFWIKAEILADGSSQYPDIIVFAGKRFQVMAIEPWNNYGEGWNKGLCVAEEMA